MIDDYSDISTADLDELERRRERMEKQRISERQTLLSGILCSDVIDDTFKLTELALKERDVTIKGDIVTVANKVAGLAVKLQQIHMMRAGLLPPISANKETQERWENKAISDYETRVAERKKLRGLHS